MARVKLHQPRSNRTFEAWKIPAPGAEPEEAMVDWLSVAPADMWEGDESGIRVRRQSGTSRWYETGRGGDYIFWDEQLACLRIARSRSIGPKLEFELL